MKILALTLIVSAAVFAGGTATGLPGLPGRASPVYTSIPDGGVVVTGTVVACEAASATGTGCVNTTAQTFAGTKTFNTQVTLAGFTSGNSSSLTAGSNFSMVGGGIFGIGINTGDRGLFTNWIGSSAASNTIAAFEFKHMNGALDATDLIFDIKNSADNILFSVNQSGTINTSGTNFIFNSASASTLKWDSGGGNSWQLEATPGSGVMRFGNNTSRYMALRLSDGYTETAFGFEVNPTGSAAVTKLWGNAHAGRIDQAGTDSSGTPGNATINKPSGISAVASGATSVTITNSEAGTGCLIFVEWLADPGALVTRWWVTRASGSFTLNLSGAAGADTPFAWRIQYLL